MLLPPLNSGDTAWMLMSTALVVLMTVPGLALFYGGLVKKETVFEYPLPVFFGVRYGEYHRVIYGYPCVWPWTCTGFYRRSRKLPSSTMWLNRIRLVGSIPSERLRGFSK